MRRFALIATTAGLATLGGGWYALGAAGQDQPTPRAVAAAKTPLVAPKTERRGLAPAAADLRLAGEGRRARRGRRHASPADEAAPPTRA